MAAQTPDPDSLLSHQQHHHRTTAGDNINGAANSPSNSGSARQTRRLQLRNAGFRGASVPSRKITPNSMSSSDWSASRMNGASDVENMSPAGTKGNNMNSTTGSRKSSAVLQEIGNSTITQRPSKARRRITSKAFDPDASMEDGTYATIPTSPPQPRAGSRRQSVKTKTKVSHRRRSGSTEATKYIEHLEAELASAQSQISSITSPSVTREHTSKMRTLNVETKKLQEELADWESKYESRVQEEVDRHFTIETDLKARIRHLEMDAEDAERRVQDLEMQVEAANQSMQAVEAANVSLEKRLEMMTELLASTKIDLHAETPGRVKKHVRPKSMLPRFPTASSLMGSPERQARTQPASPLFQFTHNPMDLTPSRRQSLAPCDTSPEQTDFMSEAESIFSEDSITGDSMTSTENCESQQPNYNPWNLPPRPNNMGKPARRMRRFGAGSQGPKPLILPSASQCGYFPPASAPPLEHSKTTPTFFPRGWKGSSDEATSPLAGRRRASTIANERSVSRGQPPPFLDIPEQAMGDDSMASLSPPPSAESGTTTRRHSSVGSVPGRNLMEELSAARSLVTTDSAEPSSDDHQEPTADEVVANLAIQAIDTPVTSPTTDPCQDLVLLQQPNIDPERTASTITTRPHHHRRSRSGKISIPANHSESMLGRLRHLFGDLWRSPIVMARYLIQKAQARMRIPRPLMTVQWWLVGVLLGPMAKQRLLSSRSCCGNTDEDVDEHHLLLEDTPERQDGSDMAYGSIHGTPSTSSTSQSLDELGGRGKRRARIKNRCAHHHHHHHHRAKHSPWLWIKFSITLAFAIGAAFKDGPGSLLKTSMCRCRRKDVKSIEGANDDNEQGVVTP